MYTSVNINFTLKYKYTFFESYHFWRTIKTWCMNFSHTNWTPSVICGGNWGFSIVSSSVAKFLLASLQNILKTYELGGQSLWSHTSRQQQEIPSIFPHWLHFSFRHIRIHRWRNRQLLQEQERHLEPKWRQHRMWGIGYGFGIGHSSPWKLQWCYYSTTIPMQEVWE